LPAASWPHVVDIKPHAYDPATQPELFDGVPARRVIAFIIDFIIISIPVVLAAMFIFAFGIVTLGLGFGLYWLLPSATVIWAILYFGFTLGGWASATIGMRVMDLEMRTWYGAPAYFVLGAVHAVAFWFTVSFSPRLCCWFLFQRTASASATSFLARWSSTTTHVHRCCARPCSRCGPDKPLTDCARRAVIAVNMK
jgi:uncharacterized RDD family membrane protein YckC